MASRAELERLAERLDEVTGPDRELDADIRDALAYRLPNGCLHLLGSTWVAGSSRSIADLYTSRLDAALALVEEKLPTYRISISQRRMPGGRGDGWRAELSPNVDAIGTDLAWGSTAPLSLLVALIRSLAAQENTDDQE